MSSTKSSPAAAKHYPYSLSWNVPRVSIPSILGPLNEASYEWWFYVGYVKDSDGQWYSVFSLICQFGSTFFDFGIGVQYLSIAESGENGKFYRSNKDGITNNPQLFNGQIGDQKFEISCFNPSDLEKGDKCQYKFIGQNKSYAETACVGMIGSRYNLMTKMKCTSIDDEKDSIDCCLTLNVEDKRGTLLEVMNGTIGATYEVNQPRLEIINAGDDKSLKSVLIMGDQVKEIVEGTMILDRQAVMSNLSPHVQTVQSKTTVKTAVNGDNTQLSDKQKMELLNKHSDEIKQSVATIMTQMRGVHTTSPLPRSLATQKMTSFAAPKSFYIGHWGILNLDDGTTFSFAQIWKSRVSSMPQWQACSATGEPPSAYSSAVKYNPRGDETSKSWFNYNNGGYFLHGNFLDTNGKDYTGKIDFDINILTPALPSQSPYYKSPSSGIEYGTAWTVSINGYYDIPLLYLFADNPKSESWAGVWEGSVTIYKSLVKTKENCVGRGWFEQMGYAVYQKS